MDGFGVEAGVDAEGGRRVGGLVQDLQALVQIVLKIIQVNTHYTTIYSFM